MTESSHSAPAIGRGRFDPVEGCAKRMGTCAKRMGICAKRMESLARSA